MRISVIIPTCNKAKFLDITLSSLSKQKLQNDEKIEVVIVNDGKEEETKEVITFWRNILNIKYFKTVGKKGRSSARNLGANKASGEILIFIDDDMVLMPSLIQEHINIHKNKENLIAVGYRYRLEQSTMELFNFINAKKIAANLENVRYLPSLLDERETIYKQCYDDIENLSAPWVCLFSNNISIRKEYFLKDGFDEIYQKKWGIEDVEFGYRLYKSGTKFKLLRTAEAYHLPHAASWRKNLKELEENLSLFFRKFPEYEIELYVHHMQVGLLKYLESINSVKNNRMLSELSANKENKILTFYKNNIKKDRKLFISGIEHSSLINKIRSIAKSVNYSSLSSNCNGGIMLIGSKTNYPDDYFDDVIIGYRSVSVIRPYMTLLIQEAYRIGKNIFFAIEKKELENLLSFFNNTNDINNDTLLSLLIMCGIEKSEVTSKQEDEMFYVKISKNKKNNNKNKISISFSIDLEHPTDKTISAIELAMALYRKNINIHIQNTERFIRYEEITRNKIFINDKYLLEYEKNIVNKMLQNDLKLLSNTYFEIPVERLENNTPHIIGRADEELVGFPLNEKIDFINKEIEILWHCSEYSQDYFIGQGGDASKSFVVPMGVDTEQYIPSNKKNDRFTFMVMGSAFKESGIDVVLKAFNNAFSNTNDVVLNVYFDPIQEAYSQGFFQTELSYKAYMKFYTQYKKLYNTKIEEYKKEFKNKTHNIRIMIADSNVRNRIPNFQGCDCYVHAYRNDFCALNVLKAMSCAKIVIVVDKFFPRGLCTQDNSYVINANITSGCEHEYIPFSEYSLWAEPDINELALIMKQIYENQKSAIDKAKKARNDVISNWRWEHTAINAINSILKTRDK